MASFGDSDIYRGQVTQRTPLNQALCAIWYRLWQLTGFSTTNTPGGGIPITPPTGTYTAFHVANNGSTTIPTTAKRWAVNFVGTGTGNTFLGNTSVTGNQSFSDNGAPASAIAIGCDGSTVADGFYSTT